MTSMNRKTLRLSPLLKEITFKIVKIFLSLNKFFFVTFMNNPMLLSTVGNLDFSRRGLFLAWINSGSLYSMPQSKQDFLK